MTAFSVCVMYGVVSSRAVAAETDVKTLALPAKYTQFVYAGAGNTIAFQFESGKVGVFDVRKQKFAFEIEEVDPGDLLAGSLEKLVIVSPGKMMIRRWDLKTGKREKVALLRDSEVPKQAVMGCAGKGPLLIVGSKSSQFLDLETLKLREFVGAEPGGAGNYGLSVCASADGKTFGTIPVGYGPVSYEVWRLDLENKSIFHEKFGSTSNAVRWAQPSADGYLLLHPEGKLADGNGGEVEAAGLKDAAIIPSLDPRFVMGVWLTRRDAEDKPTAQVTFCAAADCRELFSMQGFQELVPERINSWHSIVNALKLGEQWRFSYLPEDNLIVTLPNSNDKILVRDFNLEKAVKDAELPLFYVASRPPLRVTDRLNYDVEVVSEKKAKVTLLDGPEEAKFRKGILEWKVPSAFGKKTARFLISVQSGGDEIFHSFEVAIEKPGNL